MLPCLFKHITGYDCPGCGIQRASLLLIKGDIHQSFQLYPGLIPLILLVLWMMYTSFFKTEHGQKVTLYLGSLTAIIIFGYYFYRLINHQLH